MRPVPSITRSPSHQSPADVYFSKIEIGAMSSNVGLKALHEVLVQILAELKKQSGLLELLNSDSTSEWRGTDTPASLDQSDDESLPDEQDLAFVAEDESTSEVKDVSRSIRRPAYLGAGDLAVNPASAVGGPGFLSSHDFPAVLIHPKASIIASDAPSQTGARSHSQMEDQEAELGHFGASRKLAQPQAVRRSGVSRSFKSRME